MPTNRPNYRIYPSLLDAYHSLVHAEEDWGRWWGDSEKPPKTCEEYVAECEAKLINMINRCPKEPIMVADRGTCFNAAIDMLIDCTNDPGDVEFGGCVEEEKSIGIATSLNDTTFVFDRQLCCNVASVFKGALSQYLCKAPIETSYGIVELYGYIDEWVNDIIYDIKTTEHYSFGQYEHKWQRFLYPYCVVESGMAESISEFTFYAIELHKRKRSDIITGKIYPETYTYNHQTATDTLRFGCEEFITWLEYRRGFITNQRIFGGENLDGYVGVPINPDSLIN